MPRKARTRREISSKKADALRSCTLRKDPAERTKSDSKVGLQVKDEDQSDIHDERHEGQERINRSWLNQRLERISENLKVFNTSEDIEPNRLAVERHLAKEVKEREMPRQRSFKPSESSFLLDVVLNCLERGQLYRLDSEFAQVPGVYLIYYIGTTELYSGSKIFGTANHPVYVGMSVGNVSDHLGKHRENIKKAKGEKNEAAKLTMSEFAVRVILPDIKHYAPCIAGILIEHFGPVWNKETVELSFGNAASKENLWYKFHIQQDEETITKVLATLKVADGSESKGEGKKEKQEEKTRKNKKRRQKKSIVIEKEPESSE